VPILATTALASYEAGLGNHVDGSTTWQGLTLLALLCELVGVLLAMMKYLLENLYASPGSTPPGSLPDGQTTVKK